MIQQPVHQYVHGGILPKEESTMAPRTGFKKYDKSFPEMTKEEVKKGIVKLEAELRPQNILAMYEALGELTKQIENVTLAFDQLAKIITKVDVKN